MGTTIQHQDGRVSNAAQRGSKWIVGAPTRNGKGWMRSERLGIRHRVLRFVCQGVEVCKKVDLQHSKLEIQVLGRPKNLPHNFVLRLKAKENTKAGFDRAWNCFIGQPSTVQGLEVLISALGPAPPAVSTLA